MDNERMALIEAFAQHQVENMDIEDLMLYVKTGLQLEMVTWTMDDLLEEVNYFAPNLLEEKTTWL